MVDASAKKDIQDASVYESKGVEWDWNLGYALPKFYLKVLYCVSCAIHAKVVRVRNEDVRRLRITTKKRLSVFIEIS